MMYSLVKTDNIKCDKKESFKNFFYQISFLSILHAFNDIEKFDNLV